MHSAVLVMRLLVAPGLAHLQQGSTPDCSLHMPGYSTHTLAAHPTPCLLTLWLLTPHCPCGFTTQALLAFSLPPAAAAAHIAALHRLTTAAADDSEGGGGGVYVLHYVRQRIMI